jgi:hypothetical protein
MRVARRAPRGNLLPASAPAFHDVDARRAPLLDVLARAERGEVFVLRGLLRAAGIHEALVGTCRDGVEREAGPDALRDGSFEQIHRTLSPASLPRVATAVQDALRASYRDLLGRLLRIGLGFDRALYVMNHPIARFSIPHDAGEAHREALERHGEERGHGKVTLLRPHRDCWFADPPGTINIWLAAGRVRRGNGMTIFPQAWSHPLGFVPGAGVEREQPVGRPVTFELDAGDVLVFAGDHLHASELNRTDETRHVVSFRVRRSRALALFPTERFRSFHPAHPLFERLVDPTSRRIGRALRGRTGSPARPVTAAGPGTASSLGSVDAIRPISSELCAVDLGDGRTRVVSRRCPHQGADLALGHLDGGRIVCPWHNLPFDLETGRSPCASVAPLRVSSP